MANTPLSQPDSQLPNLIARSVTGRARWLRRVISPWVQRWLQTDRPSAGAAPRAIMRRIALLRPADSWVNPTRTHRLASSIINRFPQTANRFEPRPLQTQFKTGNSMVLVGVNESVDSEPNSDWLKNMPSFDEIRRSIDSARTRAADSAPTQSQPGEKRADWLEAMPSFDEIHRAVQAARANLPPKPEPSAPPKLPPLQRTSAGPAIIGRRPKSPELGRGRRVVSRVEEVTPGSPATPQPEVDLPKATQPPAQINKPEPPAADRPTRPEPPPQKERGVQTGPAVQRRPISDEPISKAAPQSKPVTPQPLDAPARSGELPPPVESGGQPVKEQPDETPLPPSRSRFFVGSLPTVKEQPDETPLPPPPQAAVADTPPQSSLAADLPAAGPESPPESPGPAAAPVQPKPAESALAEPATAPESPPESPGAVVPPPGKSEEKIAETPPKQQPAIQRQSQPESSPAKSAPPATLPPVEQPLAAPKQPASPAAESKPAQKVEAEAETGPEIAATTGSQPVQAGQTETATDIRAEDDAGDLSLLEVVDDMPAAAPSTQPQRADRPAPDPIKKDAPPAVQRQVEPDDPAALPAGAEDAPAAESPPEPPPQAPASEIPATEATLPLALPGEDSPAPDESTRPSTAPDAASQSPVKPIQPASSEAATQPVAADEAARARFQPSAEPGLIATEPVLPVDIQPTELLSSSSEIAVAPADSGAKPGQRDDALPQPGAGQPELSPPAIQRPPDLKSSAGVEPPPPQPEASRPELGPPAIQRQTGAESPANVEPGRLDSPAAKPPALPDLARQVLSRVTSGARLPVIQPEPEFLPPPASQISPVDFSLPLQRQIQRSLAGPRQPAAGRQTQERDLPLAAPRPIEVRGETGAAPSVAGVSGTPLPTAVQRRPDDTLPDSTPATGGVAPAPGLIQRAEEESSGATETEAARLPDLDRLARQVFPIIKRLLAVERERSAFR